jgi:hypothetical protein
MNLNKKLFVLVVLLNLAGLSQANEAATDAGNTVARPNSKSMIGRVTDQKEITVTLPSASVIHQRLKELGLEHFMEKTGIDKELGGAKKYPLGVALAVELSLFDYAKYLKDPKADFVLTRVKPSIIKAILRDSPAAIAELEKKGILTKEKK